MTVLVEVNFLVEFSVSESKLVSKLNIGVANIKKTKKKAVFIFVGSFRIRTGDMFRILILGLPKIFISELNYSAFKVLCWPGFLGLTKIR